MSTSLPASALPLTPADQELVDLARNTIDAATDAGPGEDGIHTMGAAVRTADGGMHADYYPAIRVILPTPAGPVSIPAGDLLPLGFVPPAA